MSRVSVLFVCLGNICRSPTAHGIFQGMVEQAGLEQVISVDSAGTGDWHLGHAPDKRAAAHAAQRGYDLSALRARLVTATDFSEYDYILGMDDQNLANLEAMKPADYPGYLGLFLDFSKDNDRREVPDPYFGEGDGFDLVLDLVEGAAGDLLAHIRERHL